MIGCTQMPRKLRLGRMHKNGERKGQKVHLCVHVHGQALNPSKYKALKIFPVTINTKAALNQLLKLVDTLNICAGHPDQHFLDLADSHKGKFQSIANSTVAIQRIPSLSMEKYILVLFTPLLVRF